MHLGLRNVRRQANHVARLLDVGALVDVLEQRRVLGRTDRSHIVGLATGADGGAALLRQHHVVDAGLAPAVLLLGQVGLAGHRHLQRRAVLQGLGNLVQIGLACIVQYGAAGRKCHLAGFCTAAKGARQQRKGRGDGLHDQVADHLEDDGCEPELRIIERAADRQVQIDHAIAVRQQGHCQLDGQARRSTLHRVTELQLVQHQLVGRGELAVRLHVVLHVHTHLAALDAVARIFDAVGREWRQFQIAHLAVDIERQRLGQRVELAGDVERRRAFGLAAQLQIGELRRRTRSRRLGRESAHAASQLGQVGRVVGPDEMVTELDRASRQSDGTHVDDGAGRGRRGIGSGSRRRGRCRSR
ncbi:hypothetical protein D3C72_1263410 [compost metagenome]